MWQQRSRHKHKSSGKRFSIGPLREYALRERQGWKTRPTKRIDTGRKETADRANSLTVLKTKAEMLQRAEIILQKTKRASKLKLQATRTFHQSILDKMLWLKATLALRNETDSSVKNCISRAKKLSEDFTSSSDKLSQQARQLHSFHDTINRLLIVGTRVSSKYHQAKLDIFAGHKRLLGAADVLLEERRRTKKKLLEMKQKHDNIVSLVGTAADGLHDEQIATEAVEEKLQQCDERVSAIDELRETSTRRLHESEVALATSHKKLASLSGKTPAFQKICGFRDTKWPYGR